MSGKSARGKRNRVSSVTKRAPAPVLEENDDEAEKMEQFRLRQMKGQTPPRKMRKKSLAPVDVNGARTTLLTQEAKKPLSNSQLSELYTNCMSLANRNARFQPINISHPQKITQKNAWSVKLVDYLDDVLDNEEFEKEDETGPNFQRHAQTLDASVKIYSSRVDSVHTDTHKMLGGLSRGQIETEKDEDQVAEAAAPSFASPQSKRRAEQSRRAERPLVTTLEKPENLNVDSEFSVDPLFRKTSAAFDEGGARGLLLNHLSVYNGCEIIFDSSDAANNKVNPDLMSEGGELDLKPLRDLLLSISSDCSRAEILPMYSNFKFSQAKDLEAIELDEEFMEPEPSEFDDDMPHELDDSDGMKFDLIAQEKALADELNVQAYHPIQNPPPSGFTDGDDDGPIRFEDGDFASPSKITGNQLLTAAFSEEGDNDYAYYNPKTNENWRAPSFWKYQKISTEVDSKVKSSLESAKPKTKAKKKAVYIDFTSPNRMSKEELNTYFTTSTKARTTLTKAALSKMESQAHLLLLPVDERYDPANFGRLFNRPNWKAKYRARKQRQSFEDDGLPEVWVNFDESPENDQDPLEFYDNGVPQESGGFDYDNIEGELELIQSPSKVDHIRINYATAAKNVDVKALKRSMWSQVSSIPEQDENGESSETTFQKVIDNMPNFIPDTALTNVTVPYYFICLLHLCNENNVELSLRPDGDLLITKE